MLKSKLNIPFIFFGSSQFAADILNNLLNYQWRPSLVITTPSKAKGRKHVLSPTPVYLTGIQHHLRVITPDNLKDPKFLDSIKEINPQLAILVAYGKFIPKELLKILHNKLINLHPSLLPKYRGATPIQSVILNDDKVTGVTIFIIDEKIDHGPIIAQKRYNITNNSITSLELSSNLMKLGSNLLRQSLPQWIKGEIIPYPQNETLVTYCHKLTSQDEAINWQVSSRKIDCRVRALNPNPGTFTMLGTKIFKIISGKPSLDNNQNLNLKPGEIFEVDGQVGVKCQMGSYLIIDIQPAGKRVMSSRDFLRGNKWIIGQQFNEK